MPSLAGHVLFLLFFRSCCALFTDLRCLFSAKNCRNAPFYSKKLKNSVLPNGQQHIPIKNPHVTLSSRGTYCEGQPLCAAYLDSSSIASTRKKVASVRE